MKALVAWLEDRTGMASLMHAALYEHVPGGARWRYVWGSTLVFAFFVQTITGIFLWMCYSPSGDSAWESVYYIQYHLQGGWLLRGLHHFMAQAMVVLLALHLMQVVIDGAYRAPREVNFWLGLILMQIVLGLSLTGYLLPWDEKGYWATRVATNLMGVVPVVGPKLQQLVVGGSEYGSYTLTRFFALHAGVLPALLVGFLVVHVALFRRHGLTVKQPLRGPDATFWPDQILKDSVACLAILIVVLLLIVRPVLSGQHGISEVASMAHPGDYLGADLGAPADPASQYSAARPEWYFLFLFQFLKLFSGYGERGELMGAIVIPGAVMLLLFLMPLVGRWKLGHRFNIGLLACLMLGVVLLTGQAFWDDNLARESFAGWVHKPKTTEGTDLTDKEKLALARYEASESFLKAVEESEVTAARARTLARELGIPPQGAISLVRGDPKQLFVANCASCHSYQDPLGSGIFPDKASAPNLYGFASRKWIAGLLDPKQIITPAYFGATKHMHKEDGMVGFVTGADFAEVTPAERAKIVIALSAQAHLPGQKDADAEDAALIAAGTELIKTTGGCTNCHAFRGEGALGTAPDLTDYGTREWIIGMISNPEHERFYKDLNDRMPAFAPSFDPVKNRLSQRDLERIADWLRGEWIDPLSTP